jgi:hypothetical protein
MNIAAPELEQAFQTFRDVEDRRHTGTSTEALAFVLLDDPAYAREVKYRGWNGTVTMLDEPKVAVKYAYSWGIPTSKSAHAQRADYFEDLATVMGRAYDDLVERALDKYGDGSGVLISGVVRDHFPEMVKKRLRFLAQGQTVVKKAARLHGYLSKTRSPLFK